MFKAILAILLLALAAGLAVWSTYFRPMPPPTSPAVTIDGTTFAVELARTQEEQELGLGGRDSLPAGRGMLFVFPAPGNWGFWMKDTRISLDIIWARSDGTIISIARNVATSTYAQVPPEIFYPAEADALYVLEVNAGAAAAFKPGDVMTIAL